MRTFLVFAALVAAARAEVMSLTSATVEAQVMESGKSTFLKVYAPWCGHCKSMAQTWRDLADEYEGDDKTNIVIAEMDCADNANRKACKKLNVNSFPTILFWNAWEIEKVMADTSPLDEGEDEPAYHNLYSRYDEDERENIDKFIEFVTENTKIPCWFSGGDCDEKDQAMVDKYGAMDEAALKAELATLQAKAAEFDAVEPALKAKLNAEYQVLKTEYVAKKKKLESEVILTKRALKARGIVQDGSSASEQAAMAEKKKTGKVGG